MPETVPRPHPVKAILADRRLTVTNLGERVGVNSHTLGRVLNGYVVPWPSLRRHIAVELDLPEAALFREAQ